MAGRTKLAGEIERQGRKGGLEDGWLEIEGTGRRMAIGLPCAGVVKLLCRHPFFSLVVCKTLKGLIFT
jgi:hypothetical protein